MQARFKTEYGDFVVALDLRAAPITAGYFRDIIKQGGFDGASFFRIVSKHNASMRAESPIEVIQGGLREGDPQPVAPVEHEPTTVTGLVHNKWAISAARYAPGETYGSFFICMRDEPVLNHGGARHPDGQGFAVFGAVEEGHDVLESIFAAAQSQEMLDTPISIISCVFV